MVTEYPAFLFIPDLVEMLYVFHCYEFRCELHQSSRNICTQTCDLGTFVANSIIKN